MTPDRERESAPPPVISWAEQLRAELVAAAQREVDAATSGRDRCARAGRPVRRPGAR